MNRIDRLMGITLFLQGRRVTRAEDIARKFEISLRTVYRDVAALSEVGVPVIAEAGVGYALMKGYYLPPIMFTEDEAAALGMAALALSRSSDPSLDASMNSALMKVRTALPLEQRTRLERIEESVAFGWRSRKPSTDSGVAQLIDIQASLADAKAIRIDYRAGGRSEVSSRTIEPLGLIHYKEYWHLIAWCRLREDYRDFRLDRVEKLDKLNEKCSRHRDFDLAKYLEEQHEVEDAYKVKVLFQGYSVDRAKREWSLGLVAEDKVEDGSILTLSTGSLDWMVGWLLSFCSNATVLEPPELKEFLADEARVLAEHHGR